MDLRQLHYFVTVAEERHLRRAAERLHLSQPPLTRHIKALEEELGVELFTRTPRGMALTDAGETLLRDARAVFGMVESAAERARRSGLGQLGRLDVGIYGSATFGAVPDVLNRFRARHPDVEIQLHYAQSPAQVSALRQGRVTIVFERLLPNDADIEIELVAREPLVVAVNENHRLAGLKSVELTQLRTETLRIGNAPMEAARLVEMCHRHGFEPHFAPAASDVIMSTLLTAIGTEVALVPTSMTNVKFPGVRYVPLQASPDAYMDLHCFYLKNERSPLLYSMLDVIRAYRSESLQRPARRAVGGKARS
jgi:DNA-binding transcriptional LysR family regulator